MDVLIRLPNINSKNQDISENEKIINFKIKDKESFCEEYLKYKIFEKTFIPIAFQYLKLVSSNLDNIELQQQQHLKVYDLLLRVNGGKGGFGSLLKSSGTKVGQKKTTNFDACRDLSGRRLRHVNNEARIKQWLEDEEARKIAMQELKKKFNDSNEKHVEEFNDTQFQKETEDIHKKVSNSVEQGLKLQKENKNLENNKTTTTTTTTTTTATPLKTVDRFKKPSNNNTKPISMLVPDFDDDDEEEEEEEESEEEEKDSNKTKVSKTK
ncbi:hypothetical protein ACTFIY_003632 [Dictyostelium cf. discoideum]